MDILQGSFPIQFIETIRFLSWQFRRLSSSGKIKKGKRQLGVSKENGSKECKSNKQIK
jgi:hypothetical protein